jgi:peptide/nickel transport system substrate-binding protein
VLVENRNRVGLNVQITMRENWSQVMAPGAGRGAIASFGPSGQPSASGEWRNDEAARMLDALQSSTDLDKRRGVPAHAGDL